MALTGNIEVFPLPEVLRLLARSGRNGCLRVVSGAVDGRIYIREGTLSLATVSTDAEFVAQVASSGVVEREMVEGRDPINLGEALAAGRNPEDLTEIVREHVIEALYRIRRPEAGTFEFLVDAESRFRTGQAFDTEQVVAEADRRAVDWADIEQTIADMHLPVRMVRELRQDEVNVSAATWRVLASLDGGSSVAEIARHLGTTEFRAAREVASLIRSSLIEPAQTPVPQSSEPLAGSWVTEPPRVDEVASTTEIPEPQVPDVPWTTDHGADSVETVEPVEPVEPVESPWTAAVADESTAPAPSADVDDAPTEDRSQRGWWAEAIGEADTGDEVDTDEFLESVFSEVEGGDADEAESGFSMGLLRRRRMGPVTRDMSGSD